MAVESEGRPVGRPDGCYGDNAADGAGVARRRFMVIQYDTGFARKLAKSTSPLPNRRLPILQFTFPLSNLERGGRQGEVQCIYIRI